MSDPVLGDPASCSQAGGALRQLAARLRTAGRPASEAFATGDAPRPHRVEVEARRRLDTVTTALTATTTELDRLGSAVQAHATELAEAVAAGRALVARAQAAGLDVVDGTVVQAWGVTGIADSDAAAARQATAVALQAELDVLRHTLGSQRAHLAGLAGSAGQVLASHAAALRR
jgi:hypothetical protein